MKAILVISERDNVGTALEALSPGRGIQAGDASITVSETIPRGHKVAVRAIGAGEAVVKYGSPIGTATVHIPAGTHVHTHNVASGRGRGDLPREPDRAQEGRLAEPPDDSNGTAEDRPEAAEGRRR